MSSDSSFVDDLLLQLFDPNLQLRVFMFKNIEVVRGFHPLFLATLPADASAFTVLEQSVLFHGPVGSHGLESVLGDGGDVDQKLPNSDDVVLVVVSIYVTNLNSS